MGMTSDNILQRKMDNVALCDKKLSLPIRAVRSQLQILFAFNDVPIYYEVVKRQNFENSNQLLI